MSHKPVVAGIFFVLIALAGCSGKVTDGIKEKVVEAVVASRFGGNRLEMPADIIVANPTANAERNAYFGDLHVHTNYSFDAFAFGTIATPYDAYRYAIGEVIKHPAGFDVQLRQPLDFYAVTDHAMFLGALKAAADTSTEFSKLEFVTDLHNLNAASNLNTQSVPQRIRAFSIFLPGILSGIGDGDVDVEMINDIARDAWSDTIKAAEAFNKPGEFTTFVAYEFTTSSNDRGNLHRNVFFRGADKLPAMPFSRFHSQNPEGLWDWMDDLREQGIESLAIPHNSNGSNGQMFKLVDWAGDPMDETYALQRIRNEPLIEITQVKGTSETHPALSETDEWANFEIMPYRIATTLASEPSGSYAREALLNGLSFQDRGITNPYKFGFIAASDTHTAATTDNEADYFSKAGLLDSNGIQRGSVPMPDEAVDQIRGNAPDQLGTNVKEIDGSYYRSGAFETWGASGLAAVWAEENTRDAIYNAFRRKETFATSGPRIRLRFFAGYGFNQDILSDKDMVMQAYASGVSMGSDLLAKNDHVPSFIVWGTRDPVSASLQRVQVVKGWTINGEHHERVYDVACSDDGKIDPATHRCPDNGASVDLTDCSITSGTGAAELKTTWTDPDFDSSKRAFYYARVLENPTCRWSTWDAIRAGTSPRPDLAPTIQERAWSSPIWFVPNRTPES
ncbi:MAG: DUF3604 domain-containing protein [bacterium]|nr:DUF3604 domain-containing protein [Gammaproteobacteria bacterium]